MLNFRIYCVVLLASFAFNIYLTYLIQSSSSENRCLEMGSKFANGHNRQSLAVDTVVVSISIEDNTKQPMHIGANKDVFKTEENYVYPEHQNSLFSEQNGLIRHCITDEIFGVVPNNTQTVKFSLSNDVVAESARERMSSFQEVFRKRSWGGDLDTSYSGFSASGELMR